MKNSSVATFFFFFLSAFVYTSSVYSQSDSCGSYLNIGHSLPFTLNTTSLNCAYVWSSQGFILRYLQDGPYLWSFVLSAPNTNTYISIGFSSDGKMVGSSAIAGWVPANGTGIVKQYYLGGTEVNLVYPDQGDLHIIKNSTTIVSQSSRLYLAFQLNINQPLTKLIYAVGPWGSIPSSNYYLAEHRDYTSTSINYASDQSGSTQSSNNLTKAHGAINMLGWGILVIIGVIVARYFKHHDPIWFYIHTSIQLIAFILGIAGIITGFLINGSSDVGKHKALGIFILVLGCFQVTASLIRPEKTSKVRRYWNWFHHYCGKLAIIISIGNIFYGIHLADGGTVWNASYGIVLAILFLTTIVFEVKMRMTK